MKYLILLLAFCILSGCATTEPYNNEQIRTQCPIGYHEEYSKPMSIKKDKDGRRIVAKDEFKCVPD